FIKFETHLTLQILENSEILWRISDVKRTQYTGPETDHCSPKISSSSITTMQQILRIKDAMV
ncbi:hypothetical protein A2U01_0049567, partial [Trifolium medium]|nr:hypothetical protein [Trifolium medium]